jgi:hypothetical protein
LFLEVYREVVVNHIRNQAHAYLKVEEVSEGGDEPIGPEAREHQNAVNVRRLYEGVTCAEGA